jgi:hypothetical protein
MVIIYAKYSRKGKTGGGSSDFYFPAVVEATFICCRL